MNDPKMCKVLSPPHRKYESNRGDKKRIENEKKRGVTCGYSFPLYHRVYAVCVEQR